ncbi:MAG: membrane protein insertion efficiency factor YidD [Candidatus Hydrogenedentes bacterium]|nr:membrane protein insertion efficiency factor YidD [Candidatus Hydrogenedentota bacterium]
MGRVFIALIRLYQITLSPFLGQNCRFTPSCSRYAIEAIEKHGALKGLGYAIWRILRCQPFCQGGHDPVP